MRILSALVLASLVCTPVCALAFADEIPSGESLMKRFIDSTGGDEAYAKVKSSAMTGTVDFVGHNISGSVAIYQLGEKLHIVMDIGGVGKIEQGFDGDTAWEVNALTGARILTGEEKASTVRAARMMMLNSWRDFYTAVRTVGAEDVNGKPAWKVELTPKEGKNETFYFDRDSGLLIRQLQTVASALGEIPVDYSISDYREVDGIRAPFMTSLKAMDQTMTMRFQKVVWNPDIKASQFDLPDAIKALLKKQQQ